MAVAGATFIDISTAPDFVPLLARVRASLLLFVIAMAGMAMNTKSWRPGDASRSRYFRLVGVVVAFAVLGVPFAVVKSTAFGEITEHYYKVLIQGAMVWAVCRTSGNRMTVLRAILLGAMVACVGGLIAPRGDGGRLQGSSNDANSLAMYGNLLLPLLAWYVWDKRNSLRWLGLAALPIPLATLGLAGSRGGVLAFSAMAASTVLLFTHKAPRQLRRLFPVAVLLGVIGVAAAPQSLTERVGSMLDGSDYNFSDATGRIPTWKRGMGYALDRPIFGLGIANFPEAEGRSEIANQYAEQGVGFGRFVAHSTYVQVIAELGFFGGAAFVLLFFMTIRDLFLRGRTAARTRDPDGIMLGTLAVALVGYGVSVAFLSYQYYSQTYILFGLAYGYFDSLDRADPAAPSPRRAVRRHRVNGTFPARI